MRLFGMANASTSTNVPMGAIVTVVVVTALVVAMIIGVVYGRAQVNVTVDGIITAGSYGTGANRTFWDVRRAHTVLVITCAEGSPYRQIVIEIDNPHETAARLRTQLAPR